VRKWTLSFFRRVTSYDDVNEVTVIQVMIIITLIINTTDQIPRRPRIQSGNEVEINLGGIDRKKVKEKKKNRDPSPLLFINT